MTIITELLDSDLLINSREDINNNFTNLNNDKLEASDIADFETTTELNTRDTNNRNRTNHTGTQTASTISDFDIEVSNNTDVSANTSARHTHSNKALLDTYTQTEIDLADAVTKKHTHSNKTILDNTTASFITADKTKLDGIEAGAEVNEVNEAPADNKQYVRKNTLWEEVEIPDAATWGNITGSISSQTDLNIELTKKINSDITGITGADKIINSISLTKAEYDAILIKDINTLYYITDEIYQNLFIQDTEPIVTIPSLWIDTSGGNVTFNLITP